MSRVCEICEKGSQKGKKITLIWGVKYRSIRHRQPNLIRTTIMVDGEPTRVRICSNCLKSIKKGKYNNVTQIPQYNNSSNNTDSKGESAKSIESKKSAKKEAKAEVAAE